MQLSLDVRVDYVAKLKRILLRFKILKYEASSCTLFRLKKKKGLVFVEQRLLVL